jgi:hypothetical protein
MNIDDVFDSFEKKKILQMKSLAETYVFDLIPSKSLIGEIGHYLVLSGGAFVNWFGHTSKLNDIDLFVLMDPSSQATNKLRAYLSSINFEKKNAEYLKQTNPGAKHVQEIWEGIHKTNGRKYQIIFTDYWSREDLIKEFDYKHCMVSYDVGKNMIYITRSIYDAIANKHLIVNNQNRVADWRREKFINRGFTEPITKLTYNDLIRIYQTNPYIMTDKDFAKKVVSSKYLCM